MVHSFTPGDVGVDNRRRHEGLGAFNAVYLSRNGGDRIESILCHLDYGALKGASPKVIVLKIGVNNVPLVFANGVPAVAAHGIKLCIENLWIRCPKSQVVLVKILPAALVRVYLVVGSPAAIFGDLQCVMQAGVTGAPASKWTRYMRVGKQDRSPHRRRSLQDGYCQVAIRIER